MSDLSEWSEDKEEISVEALKSFITDMREKRAEYDAAKKISNKAHEEFKKAESIVLNALESSGIKKFNVPGLGTAYTITKLNVTVPKDLASKRLLFEYMNKRQGRDATDEMLSINYQTLNAFYKQELEACKEEGKDLVVPGLGDPVEQKSVGFRKGE